VFGQCGPTGNTCKQYCQDSNDCNVGQSCLNTAGGYLCLNPQCANCFANNLDCFSYDETCEFSHCG
jgi:hypothetical protein